MNICKRFYRVATHKNFKPNEYRMVDIFGKKKVFKVDLEGEKITDHRPASMKESFYYKNPNLSKGLKTLLVALGALVLLAGVTAAVLAGLHHFGGYHTFDRMVTWMKSSSNLGLSNGELLAIAGGVVVAGTGLTLAVLAAKDYQHRKALSAGKEAAAADAESADATNDAAAAAAAAARAAERTDDDDASSVASDSSSSSSSTSSSSSRRTGDDDDDAETTREAAAQRTAAWAEGGGAISPGDAPAAAE